MTHQTGPEGKLVRKVYIEEGSSIQKEYYLSLMLHRETAQIGIMFSTEGGMDIEEVAEKTPDKIQFITVDPEAGVSKQDLDQLIASFNLPDQEKNECHSVLKKLVIN